MAFYGDTGFQNDPYVQIQYAARCKLIGIFLNSSFWLLASGCWQNSIVFTRNIKSEIHDNHTRINRKNMFSKGQLPAARSQQPKIRTNR
jgi:hypothetical protein